MISAQPAALLIRLRTETREQHDAIEHTLMLMDDELGCELYRRRLEQFYGFYKPVEQRMLSNDSALRHWLSLPERRKTALLEADLSTLGGNAPAQLPLCVDLPPLNSVADFFGCMYVLEGASLGGTVISRHVQKKLGVSPLSGGQFFYGYGNHTGAMWQQFRSAITAFSSEQVDHDAIVSSARATFETLRHWCNESKQ